MKLTTNRSNRRRQWATAMAVLLTATFAAGPALADDRRSRRHDRHDGYSQRVDRHDDHRRHDRRHPRRHYRRSYRHSRGYPVYSYSGYSSRAYYCGPCNHRFSNYNALSHHVHRVHHIPLWRLPFVIVDSVFHNIVGFIFHG